MPKYLKISPKYRTKEWLSKKYLIEKLSSQKIADIIGCDRKTIDLWMKKVNIPKREVGGSDPNALHRNKKWLIEKYINERLPLREIGKLAGLDFSVLRKWLIKFSIKLRKRGELTKGEKNYFWNGGKYQGNDGYIHKYTPDHPYCDNIGYVKEHRLVIEKHLKRYLTKKEVVHHKNRIRNDNKLKNLLLFSDNKEHMNYHYKKSNFNR